MKIIKSIQCSCGKEDSIDRNSRNANMNTSSHGVQILLDLPRVVLLADFFPRWTMLCLCLIPTVALGWSKHSTSHAAATPSTTISPAASEYDSPDEKGHGVCNWNAISMTQIRTTQQ